MCCSAACWAAARVQRKVRRSARLAGSPGRSPVLAPGPHPRPCPAPHPRRRTISARRWAPATGWCPPSTCSRRGCWSLRAWTWCPSYGSECRQQRAAAGRGGAAAWHAAWGGPAPRLRRAAQQLAAASWRWPPTHTGTPTTPPGPLIISVWSGFEATGIGRVGLNKGGVAVSLRIGTTRLAFVGCHLAAHQSQCGRRNHDVGEIIEEVSRQRGRRWEAAGGCPARGLPAGKATSQAAAAGSRAHCEQPPAARCSRKALSEARPCRTPPPAAPASPRSCARPTWGAPT